MEKGHYYILSDTTAEHDYNYSFYEIIKGSIVEVYSIFDLNPVYLIVGLMESAFKTHTTIQIDLNDRTHKEAFDELFLKVPSLDEALVWQI